MEATTGQDERKGKDGNGSMSKELKQQILEMFLGVILYELVVLAVCIAFFRDLNVFLGILAGTLAAGAFIIHLGFSVEHCVNSGDPAYAKKTMSAHAMQRMASVLVFAILIAKFTEINLVSTMVALMGIKPGAYLYPRIHKFMIRKAEKE